MLAITTYLANKPPTGALVCLVVAIVCFIIAAIVALLVAPPRVFWAALVAAGLVFFALAFIV